MLKVSEDRNPATSASRDNTLRRRAALNAATVNQVTSQTKQENQSVRLVLLDGINLTRNRSPVGSAQQELV